jgi:drug/metabolite transporter (DMT)-like permease
MNPPQLRRSRPGKRSLFVAIAALVLVLATVLSKAKHVEFLGHGSLKIGFGVIAIAAFCWAIYYLRKS